MPEPAAAFVAAVRGQLARLADPDRAGSQRAYLKSDLPLRGVRVPAVRTLTRALARELLPVDRAAWRAAITTLWDARYREERYAAIATLRSPGHRSLLEPRDIVLVGRMIADAAWWDLVDELSHVVGVLLARHPDQIRPVLLDWAVADSLWLRRSAIIAQLDAGTRTDTALLAAVIGANTDHKDFFVRKAIGWALRQHARTDPEWVRSFLAGHRLSPLSVREATRHLT